MPKTEIDSAARLLWALRQPGESVGILANEIVRQQDKILELMTDRERLVNETARLRGVIDANGPSWPGLGQLVCSEGTNGCLYGNAPHVLCSIYPRG